MGLLLHPYLRASRIRVAVVLYGSFAVLALLLLVRSWVLAAAWFVTSCGAVANMHRDHLKDDMKTFKEDVEKVQQAHAKLREMDNIPQTLQDRIDGEVGDFELRYAREKKWFGLN